MTFLLGVRTLPKGSRQALPHGTVHVPLRTLPTLETPPFAPVRELTGTKLALTCDKKGTGCVPKSPLPPPHLYPQGVNR